MNREGSGSHRVRSRDRGRGDGGDGGEERRDQELHDGRYERTDEQDELII